MQAPCQTSWRYVAAEGGEGVLSWVEGGGWGGVLDVPGEGPHSFWGVEHRKKDIIGESIISLAMLAAKGD